MGNKVSERLKGLFYQGKIPRGPEGRCGDVALGASLGLREACGALDGVREAAVPFVQILQNTGNEGCRECGVWPSRRSVVRTRKDSRGNARNVLLFSLPP